MRREQHTKPHSNPQPGHTARSYFYTPAFQYLIPTIPSTQNNILKSLDRLNNFSWFFFFPEGFLLYTPGKRGLLHSARPLAASHPPGIPPVHTGQGFSSHLCGLHSLTHRSCHAITALTLHKAVMEKWNAFSVFSLSLLKLRSATPVHWFSVLSPSQSILKGHLCPERSTYTNFLNYAGPFLLSSAALGPGLCRCIDSFHWIFLS